VRKKVIMSVPPSVEHAQIFARLPHWMSELLVPALLFAEIDHCLPLQDTSLLSLMPFAASHPCHPCKASCTSLSIVVAYFKPYR
jgi:hypothetical protein